MTVGQGIRGSAAWALRWLACGAACAVAFDIEAHDAIGQTAASAMDHEAIRQTKRLLGGQDVSDVAGWGHQVDDTFPGMARMHFQVHDDSSGQPHCGPEAYMTMKCEDSICLLNAIKHFYGKILKDEGRPIDFPAMDYNKAQEGIKFSDADAVKMLINLLGDLHQPLHVGYTSDDNGHAVKVKFRGKEMSLYDFWDKGIGETIRTEQSGFWYGGWTHVRAISSEHQADKDFWKKEGSFASFDKWMHESVMFACEKVYVHPTTGKKLAGPGADLGQVVEIDEGAYQAWNKMWLRQILMAGQRTAIVLNDILDASGAKKLDNKAKVTTKADEEKAKEYKTLEEERKKNPRFTAGGGSRISPAHVNIPVLLTNFGIACVTVPLFMVVVNYGLNPQVWYTTVLALLETDKGGGGDGAPNGAAGRSVKRTE